MSDRDVLYKLLFDALLELRIEGAETKNAKVQRLADLFHQLPNRLRDIDSGDVDPATVLAELRTRAEEKGVHRWLEQHLPAESRR
jgi:hypothetical protein